MDARGNPFERHRRFPTQSPGDGHFTGGTLAPAAVTSPSSRGFSRVRVGDQGRILAGLHGVRTENW